VGGAAGTVAKAISDREYASLRDSLAATRGATTSFFVFADAAWSLRASPDGETGLLHELRAGPAR